MAEEQSSWSTLAKVLTGAAGLLTAIVTFYTTFHKPDDHPRESSPTVVVQPAPSSSQPVATPPASQVSQSAVTVTSDPFVDSRPAAPNLAGSWQLSGYFQNGTPYYGQVDLAPNFYFQMGAQGVRTAEGSWSWDAASRNLVMNGQHVLYGYPLQFQCILGAAAGDNAWSGQCRDQTGVSTIQLSR